MSAAGPLTVIAHWQARPELVKPLLALVAELQRESLEEPGCLSYEVFQSVGAPEALVLIESYVDAAAIEAHRSSRHYRELLVDQILPLLTARRVDVLRAYAPVP